MYGNEWLEFGAQNPVGKKYRKKVGIFFKL